MSPDDFFAVLLAHKKILDDTPSLVSSNNDGLQKAYCLLCALETDLPRSKQTRYNHVKARDLFEAFHKISRTLFVLVSTSVSMTNLLSIDQNEIFPRIEEWWEQHPPSEEFKKHASSILCTLEEQRSRGDLVYRTRRSRTFQKPRNPREDEFSPLERQQPIEPPVVSLAFSGAPSLEPPALVSDHSLVAPASPQTIPSRQLPPLTMEPRIPSHIDGHGRLTALSLDLPNHELHNRSSSAIESSIIKPRESAHLQQQLRLPHQRHHSYSLPETTVAQEQNKSTSKRDFISLSSLLN